jgi:hypothetical protein
MVEYRVYTVGLDGHFAGYEPLVCADDSDAIDKARRLASDRDIELWSGPRLILRLARDGPSAEEVDAAMDGIVDEGARPKPSK